MKYGVFTNPIHQIQVLVIGAGGTGSHLMGNLARLNNTLLELEHIGLDVICYDNDIVRAHNCGRQVFFPGEIGMFKATALVNRINRAYGFQWSSYTERLVNFEHLQQQSIVITAVDNVKTRKLVKEALTRIRRDVTWIDCGNFDSGGQVWLSNYTIEELKSDIFDMFPQMTKQREPKKSCSAAEALFNQDLGINQQVAYWAAHYVWNVVHHLNIDYRGTFIDLKKGTIKSIKI